MKSDNILPLGADLPSPVLLGPVLGECGLAAEAEEVDTGGAVPVGALGAETLAAVVAGAVEAEEAGTIASGVGISSENSSGSVVESGTTRVLHSEAGTLGRRPLNLQNWPTWPAWPHLKQNRLP